MDKCFGRLGPRIPRSCDPDWGNYEPIITTSKKQLDKLFDIQKWDVRWLKLTESIASFSKDPSTKVGAIIVDSNNRIISTGYNGFPRGIKDSDDRLNNREYKYEHTIHAEINALLFAKCDINGCTIYTWPFGPCTRCAGPIIQSGIKRIVFPQTENERWIESINKAKDYFFEANVECVEYCPETIL